MGASGTVQEMSRLLAFTLEPCDALLALLRLRATSEAGRWPAQLSGRLRASLAEEFAAIEATVRTLGACYTDLEERGIAAIARPPHSRFGDVDGAMLLASFPIEVAVDLDHLKVALERGDAATRRSAAGIAGSLRMILWYAVRTDLLLCPRLQRSGEELTPDAALRFLDAYLAAGWQGAEPPQPPLPARAATPLWGTLFSAPPPIVAADALPGQESTAVFRAEALHEGAHDHPPHEFMGQGGVITAEMDRLSIEHGGGGPRAAVHPTPRPSAIEGFDATSLPTLQISLSSVLSADAQFFLAQTGARWPCDSTELESAHHTLTQRLRATEPTPGPGEVEGWVARLDRGYDELRRWAR